MSRLSATAAAVGLVLLALLASSTLFPVLLGPAAPTSAVVPAGHPVLDSRGPPVPSTAPGTAPAAASGSSHALLRNGVVTPPAPPSHLGAASPGWHSSNFFQDAIVNFYGTGLPYGFREVPYVNPIATTEPGFTVTVSAAAPLVFANVTIWGNAWPGTNLSSPISGFSPATPTTRPMVINSTDPAQASFYFDNYRFFWPGSSVSFNISLVGANSTPSEVKSASNVSVNEYYPGGFTNAATWIFTVQSPWASANFSDDIVVSTTPDVLGSTVYAPNPTQSFMVSISSVSVGGGLPPIPAANLAFTVDINGSVTSYSEPFGPANHSQMSLVTPIGPYPGATVLFNVTAWLPWEGGTVDRIHSDVMKFTWSPNGGWWHPLAGLTGNLELTTSPALGLGTTPGAVPTLPTDQPVTVTIHEPIENVTIGSAAAVYTFSDNGGTFSGTLPMTAVTANTSTVTFPGLPPGSRLTFYLEAKDIKGVGVSSGNYSYLQVGPTNPVLPASRGLLFLEFLDLSRGLFVAGFGYTVANATWSASGNANFLGFATPLLPSSHIANQLFFGDYRVTVQAFGGTQSATIAVSANSPMPVVVFYGESHPTPVTPTGTVSPESVVAAGGLIAAAVVTLPLVNWFSERRAKAEEEQRRITL